MLAILVALALVLAIPAAAHADPVEGAVFNKPDGSQAEQYAIADHLMASIDAAPAGSVIRMSFYSVTISSFVDRLIAAHDRGVHVRLLMDDHDIRDTWTRLTAALGQDHTAESFAVLCHRSCFTDYEPSYLHAKMYMFSTSGSAKRVVTISSANPTNGQAVTGWNDAYTMVGDTTMYKAYKRYFEDMTQGALVGLQGSVKADYYRVTKSGRFKTYLFPRGGSGNSSDTIYSILSNVSCSGAASGHGTPTHHTIIKIAMFQWTQYRVNLAKKLWALDDAGCDVEIVFTGSETAGQVVSELTRPGGRYGGPVLHNGARDMNGDAAADFYVHDKYLLVEGNYAGDTSTRAVFTGSANFANNALHYNNEILLRVLDTNAYRSYLRQFSDLKTWIASSASEPVDPPEARISERIFATDE
ncbi:MAG TPA: phospholipase D-like domain-containing protein [Kineosporiaceae bacterium]|nr:phospholipase D-like domain-containing protein [Kineosporiaceae bacterium]